MLKATRYILFLFLLTIALPVRAALRQDRDGNYIIASAADFLELVGNHGYWGACIVQTTDIDLGGARLTPIGNSTYPFTGSYDGRGNTIANAVLYWNDCSADENTMKGLFGYVNGTGTTVDKCASIRNMHINRIHITRDESIGEPMQLSATLDIKIGILAGLVGANTRIENICITHCVIDDGDIDTPARSFMIGGCIGDIVLAFSGTSAITNPDFLIRNIYCNTDLNLLKLSRTTADFNSQSIIGGVVGRIRSAAVPNIIPNNTVYKGTIKAPKSMVGPTVGNMRSKTALNVNNGAMLTLYAGECQINGAHKVIGALTDAEINSWFCITGGYDGFCSTRQYYGYKVYNSASTAENKVEDVNEANPSGGPYVYRTRTFLPNAKANGTAITPDVKTEDDVRGWAAMQGVNWGRWLDVSQAAATGETVERFNDCITETVSGTTDKMYYWTWNEASGVFVLNSRTVIGRDYELVIQPNDDATEYTARMVLLGTDNYVDELDHLGSFQWQESDTPTDAASWQDIPGETSKTIGVFGTKYYRVVWTQHTDGNAVLVSDYRSPRAVIYVFDKSYTENYIEWFPEDWEVRLGYLYPNHTGSSLGECLYPDGDDSNDGSSPWQAVRTMGRAYELISEDGDMNTNRIIVIGYLYDPDFLSKEKPKLCARPATVTGADNLYSLSGGILGFCSKSGFDYRPLGAPLRFDRIALQLPYNWRDADGTYINEDVTTEKSLFIICNLFDLTFDQDVEILGFPEVNSTSYGLPANIKSLPFVTIVGGLQDLLYETPLEYPTAKGYCSVPGYAVITLRSGCFARLILGGRNTNPHRTGAKPSYNILGSPDAPVRTKATVNFTDINLDDADTSNDRSRYGRQTIDRGIEVNGHPTLKYSDYCFTHDIGLIAGGQTDGTVWGDMEVNVRNGYIGRVMAGCITYGRIVDAKKPSDSFFGKTVINVYGDVETFTEGGEEKTHYSTTINEIYGGTLGRAGNDVSANNGKDIGAYFYGKSYINMYGGRIGRYTGVSPDFKQSAEYAAAIAGMTNDEKKAYDAIMDPLVALSKEIPNIYGAGGGGASGIGNDFNHTADQCIPYIHPVNGLTYGNYEAATAPGCMFPSMTFDINRPRSETFSIDQTETHVNIYGGLVEGSVYGAGYGYSNNIPVSNYSNLPGYNVEGAYIQAGILYGDSYVTMAANADIRPAVVLGNIYGGGAGDNRYYDKAATAQKPRFERVASQYGNSYVSLTAGTVGDGRTSDFGNVFAGSQGVPGHDDIAATYGRTELIVDGATVYGNIYGGSQLASIHRRQIGGTMSIPPVPIYDEGSGDTHLTIRSGIIGNNIFGGSEGCLEERDAKNKVTRAAAKAYIDGDTYVNIEGGDFIGTPYIDTMQEVTYDGDTPSINLFDNKDKYRTFNIYGGGNINCDVLGTANLHVTSSLLTYRSSFPDPRQNPNATILSTDSVFKSAYMDVTFRRFCIYGGGYGENTRVLDTDVYVSIPRSRSGVTLPHGETLSKFLEHQSFFDIAGGGFSGDVGYWASPDETLTFGTGSEQIVIEPNTPVHLVDIPALRALLATTMASSTEFERQTVVAKLYDHYVGGSCKVMIDDYTFARKIIGGGFYGSCRSADTYVRCGSLRQVYGGSLLGYVHDKALLQFGNRTEDFIGELTDGSGHKTYVLSTYDDPVEGAQPFDGDVDEVPAEVWAAAEAEAKSYNDYIFITENIYGGNDVKGIIGTKKWEAPESTPGNPIYALESSDNAPLFCTDVDKTEQGGIVFNIYGGTFMGDVYCAGNGHYRGYYVPAWVRYEDGPERMYRILKPGNEGAAHPFKGKVYRSRPMVGSVNVNLRGNSENDLIHIYGNFFGGGRECTIGQWNTFLPMEDPRRLVKGGHLHVNIGGYVDITGNVYLGAEGRLYGQQPSYPEAGVPDVTRFNGSTTRELEKIGDLAYYHWYYDTDKQCYLPGFPAPGKVDGNFGMTGEHMFRGYMKNIEMEGDIELTFFRYLYERDSDTGEFLYWKDSDGNDIIDATGRRLRVRKHWVPGELAITAYDASGIRMNSFFLGGLCGSMTNNRVMIFNHAEGREYDEDERQHLIDEGKATADDLEEWGSVYRVALPAGVTLRENVVMGSENATIKYYPYADGCTSVVKTRQVGGIDVDSPSYVYEGGMVTHSGYAFDLIVYNDVNGLVAPARDLPDDFYLPAGRAKAEYQYNGTWIGDLMEWDVINGDRAGTHLLRRNYTNANGEVFAADQQQMGLFDNRFGLAVRPEAGGVSAFLGVRENRRASGSASADPVTADRQTMVKLSMVCNFDIRHIDDEQGNHLGYYGGNVYGGCYNSGIVIGDVVINVASDLIGNTMHSSDPEAMMMEYSKLRYNVGRVFGGGFGKDTYNKGDTYINLILGFRGLNVFGGGMEGNVSGSTNITYYGSEDVSYVYGSIYGGGLRGSVGTEGVTEIATNVRLFSGNVKNVYGGSCMGDLYGRTFVELCDELSTNISHLDMGRILSSSLMDIWGGSRLIAGSVFGGNDIAGNIYPYVAPTSPAPAMRAARVNEPASDIADFGKGYTTSVLLHEIRDPKHSQQSPAAGEPGAKTSPGAANGYSGFPLVGNLYGGSNSDYGVLGDDSYLAGEVELATGIELEYQVVKLGADGSIPALVIPHVDKAILKIEGGAVINGYGGGNMSTITDELMIDVEYPAEAMEARAGFATEAEFDRVWAVLQLSSDQQQDEVTTVDEHGHQLFTHQIYRLFGGNDNADMSIQPSWNLVRGRISSLYSGGNFGKMTYYNPTDGKLGPEYEHITDFAHGADFQARGLTLTVNSPDIVVDNVYGGGRVGDVEPAIPAGHTPPIGFYGATLNIVDGIIEHVYGGNDVAGYIAYGTNVNVFGAISGDVYCAGNGNYLYKYDRYGNLFDYRSPSGTRIGESYEFETSRYSASRYFMLPARADYGFAVSEDDGSGNPVSLLDDEGHSTSYSATDAQTVMAINAYRPNVERTKVYIQGRPDNRVWVKGSVYCGGNSSTVVPGSGLTTYDVDFKIGSHVAINGVFLGSNGYSMTQGPTMMLATEKLNARSDGSYLSLASDNDLTPMQVPAYLRLDSGSDLHPSPIDKKLYPTVLDLYMRAVEIVNTPNDFNFPEDLDDAYIGEFCVGGNRGSMMTGKTIDLTFPESLVIYGHIIGGCKDANVKYNGVTHVGGLTRPLAGSADAPAAGSDGRTKVDIKVKSRFRPLAILYPDENMMPPISLIDYMIDENGESIMIPNPAYDPADPSKGPAYVPDPSVPSERRYYHNQQCNVYGGCFTSGTTIGDINIDIFSDMLRYDQPDCIDKRAVINGINDVRSWRSFTVVGGGYGPATEVRGDIRVRMLPMIGGEGSGRTVQLPSLASVFAGSQEGLIVGSTSLEIRAGKVLANAYGASEAAKMYGSTSVVVGYPRYYRALRSGVYKVKRADNMSMTAIHGIEDPTGDIAVPRTVAYSKGDILPDNLVQMMLGRLNDPASISGFKLGMDVADDLLTVITPANIGDYFAPVTCAGNKTVASVPDSDPITPAAFGALWDDITIWIGDQGSNYDIDAPYYGHGNVYGGGYVPNSSNIALTGANTVLRYTDEFHPYDYHAVLPEGYDPDADLGLVGFGGNAAVMLWDNPENADMTLDLAADHTADGSRLCDHVHIGTGRYKLKENVVEGASRMGLYLYDATDNVYVYQTAGEISAEDIANEVKYYEKHADGGVYGGGRKVFVEGFRSIDLAYYGYAEHTPGCPKLLNTLQRSDVATVTDCCMALVGASDFTIDDSNNTLYAINRVGELRMVSSLPADQPLVPGVPDPDHSNIIKHNEPRCRNYIAFTYAVNHLGAFASNWILEKVYHTDEGLLTTEESDDPYCNREGAADVASYVTHKHDIIDLYEYFIAYKRASTPANCAAMVAAYREYCNTHTDQVVRIAATDEQWADDAFWAAINQDHPDELSRLTKAIEDTFKKRNVGTSANMIGINSGYALRFENENKDGIYFGPVYGVTEVKLLTVAIGEGGGYLYALNHHYHKDVDTDYLGNDTGYWCREYGQDFLMTTGNFVFPGAAYFMKEDNKYNYIIDDCFPMSKGYYDYEDAFLGTNSGAPGRSRAAAEFNVNEVQEVHYWYISGNTYTYNVNVTGITSDKHMNFFLANEDDMVNFVSVAPGTQIKVKSVKWFKHNEGESCETDGCDLRNLDKDYALFFTLDHDCRNTHTYGDYQEGAWVAQIPRRNYELKVTDGVAAEIWEDGYDPASDLTPNPNAFTDTFGNYTDSEGVVHVNNPRLGIRLEDLHKNRLEDQEPAAGREYFAEHLQYPHNLQVVIEALNPGETVPFTYVINLTIDYVLGPLIYGQIDIENCALPGEYIYANANNVYVDVDGENFGIVKQYWKLYPNDSEGYRVDEMGRRVSVDGFLVDDDGVKTEEPALPVSEDLSLWGMFSLEHTEKVVHLPAYWYQNGWELTYIVNVNGFEFESTLPFSGPDPAFSPDPEHPEITAPIVPLPGNRLQVHNYHRMKPAYLGSMAQFSELEQRSLLLEPGVLDLKLVPGARVYIEDDEDVAYFFRYLAMHQDQDYDDLSALGQPIGPRYAEGIEFYLMTDGAMPSSYSTRDIIFRGRFRGNGRKVTIPADVHQNFINQGWFFNTGFYSLVNDNDTKVFAENHGSVYNCYFFNVYGKGSFLGKDRKDETLAANGHAVYNCYQNTMSVAQLSNLGYRYNELMALSTEAFRYGQVAYNLNGFYLQKRHKLLHQKGEEGTIGANVAENNTRDLVGRDMLLRLSDVYDDFAIPSVESLFSNGDYRYATYRDDPTDIHYTGGLRTFATPNYLDYMGQRANGTSVTMHKTTHDIDHSRWCETHQKYHPNYYDDYIFFGEDLSVDLEGNTEMPTAYNGTNRVYRVGGYYGSQADKGYYLNRKGFLDTPKITAVDFVGYRDRDLYEPYNAAGDTYSHTGRHGTLKEADRLDIEQNGWVIKQSPDAPFEGRTGGWQEVFMPPTMDMPWKWEQPFGTGDDPTLAHDFNGFDVNSDKVTHNLLIYTAGWSEAMTEMAKFHYTDYAASFGLGSNDHSFALHDESTIRAHHIIDNPADGGIPMVYGDYFHLVDGHDFNAPVAFRARQAWYNRQPADYADEYTDGSGYTYKTAWEGVCLPFDVARTYAASTNLTVMQDIGEITHFFGDEWKGHEYWLRRFSGIDGQKLVFQRPTEANRGAAADSVSTYYYSNTTFYDLYRQYGYDESNVADYNHDRLYHSETGALVRPISGYRHLTRSIPYIVAYPGERYYEFDLSGKFYRMWNDKVDVDVPQTICYFAKSDNAADTYITIPVTDSHPLEEYTYGDYTVKGTFVHVTNSDDLSKSVLYNKVDNLGVLDVCYPAADPANDVYAHHGESFVAADDGAVVLPFRVYLTGKGPLRKPMNIVGEKIDLNVPDDEGEYPDDEDLPADEEVDGVDVWVEGETLVIRTPRDLDTYIYNFAGQRMRRVRAFKGENRYNGLIPGFYIVLKHKFKI